MVRSLELLLTANESLDVFPNSTSRFIHHKMPKIIVSMICRHSHRHSLALNGQIYYAR